MLSEAPPEVNRQRGNEAFAEFLMLLKFPAKEDLKSLFTCGTCESRGEDGEEKRMDVVIMDGTALGILGTLPEFERLTSVVPPIQRISTLQYIMRSPKHRQFVDCVLLSARKDLSGSSFKLKPPRRLGPKLGEMYKKFMEEEVDAGSEIHLCVRFLRFCFEIAEGNAELQNDETVEAEDEPEANEDEEETRRTKDF